MHCPRCESSVLEERDRSGLSIDVCTSCRGVWLDRGELEKLLSLAKRELEEERAYYGASSPPVSAQPERPRDYDREPPSSSRRHHGRDSHGQAYGARTPYKKRSWLENLGEIFD
jgi:hypothetical protein